MSEPRARVFCGPLSLWVRRVNPVNVLEVNRNNWWLAEVIGDNWQIISGDEDVAGVDGDDDDDDDAIGDDDDDVGDVGHANDVGPSLHSNFAVALPLLYGDNAPLQTTAFAAQDICHTGALWGINHRPRWWQFCPPLWLLGLAGWWPEKEGKI